MSLYPFQHHGEALHMLLGQPDWAEGITITHRLDTQIEEGLTGIEARSPDFGAFRLEFEGTIFIRGENVMDFRDNLLELRGQRIAAPLFPDCFEVGERIYSSPLVASFDEEMTSFELEEDSRLPLSAPLMIGRFLDQPEVSIEAPGMTAVKLKIVEDSSYAERVTVRVVSVPQDWPESLQMDWTGPEAGLQSRLERLDIGEGRLPVMENAETLPRLTQQGAFVLGDRQSIRELLSFYLARQGRTESFRLPHWMIGPEESATGRYRFARNGIVLKFAAPGIAVANLAFVQAPDFEGEAAARPSTAYLFEFVYETPTPIIDRYTSFERSLVYRGQTFESVPIEHGERKQSTNPAKDEIQILSGDFRDSRGRRSPLWRRIGYGLERKLLLTIYVCDPNNVEATAQVFWRGSCGEVTPKGRKFEARCIPFAGRMESLVPGTILKSTCNNFFCDSLCDPDGRLATRLTVAHPVRSNVGSTVTLDTALLPEGYFAGGWIEIGDGDRHEFRAILNNDADAGKLRLHLQRPLRFDHAGETATLRPDCDGQPSRCKAYGNYTRFRGFPFIPADNPVLPDTTVNVDYSKK